MKPSEFIKFAINKKIVVKTKWNMKIIGILEGYDSYMNIVLKNAEKYKRNSWIYLNNVLIRNNNIKTIEICH